MLPRIASPLAPLCLLGASLLLSACAREEVRTYRVAKEPSPTPPAANSHGALPHDHPPVTQGQLPEGHPPVPGAGLAPQAGGGMMAGPSEQDGGPKGVAAGAPLVWSAPEAWQPRALGSMRFGSYTLPGTPSADLSLSMAGGNLADNLNRWRGQLGLPAWSAEDIAANTQRLTTDGGLELVVVDLRGASGNGILGAILPGERMSTFFKATGPGATLDTHKAAFLTFLKSVRTR